MVSKKHKRISLLLLVSMLFSFCPKEAFAVELSSANETNLGGSEEYSNLFDELTTLINSEVDSDISNERLTRNLEDKDFEKAIAQREFIRNAGASTIEKFISVPEKKEFMDWLFNNVEAMTLFLEGGEPISTYSKAFEVWFEIWSKDADSHKGYELKLAVASALKFGDGVPKWYTSRVLVTPYERYNYFKVREAEGKFPTSMKTRTVWDLKNIIDAPVSNWDLDYAREVIHAGRYNSSTEKVDIKYPPYISTSIYKDENGNPYSVFSASGDQFFGPNATIKEVFEIGGVCGTASKYGAVVNKSFGIPGFLVGQPGHAAHIFNSPNSAGKWDLGYDVFGWGESHLQDDDEREHIPYSNYDDTISRVPYVFVYEKSREDEASLHKSMQLKWIANALEDATLAQEVRKIAMETNKWNIDVWRNYIDSLKSSYNEELEKMKIPNSSITVNASSENNGEKAKNTIDGNKNTIWHTKYSGDRTYLPQWINFAFDKEYEVNRFVYVPRNNGGNGTVTKYNLYKSIDGENYELISSGNLANDDSEKVIQFKSTNAKYLKFEAIEGVSNYAAASEFKIYKPLENSPVTNEQWQEVANSITSELKDQPAAVYDLFRLIQSFVITPETQREEYQKYIVALNAVLDGTSDEKQKSIAEFIRNKMAGFGFSIADFNFDGENAGRLMGSKLDTEYSLDGGNTWKAVIEENMKLSDEEIASITEEHGINVRIKNTNENIHIPIYKAPSLPNIYVNDSLNKIFNIDDDVYYSIDEGKTWIQYESEEKLPDLSGDLKLMVKIPAKGKTLGSETKTFEFTSKSDDSLILPSDIDSVEANEDPDEPVTNAYDGNIYTFWHTNYSDDIKPLPQAITFELKDATDIVKLEYMPRQDSSDNGTITKYNVYASEDGEDFTLMTTGTWAKDKTVKTAMLNAKGAKFIRLEATEGVKNYASAAEIRLYKGEVKAPIVSFSFDGDKAGRLDGANTEMEYSIDGETWKPVTEASMLLPSEDMMNIKTGTVMHVRFKNSTYETKINFSACSKTPNVSGDDGSNTITGLDSSMDYSVDDGESWIRYNGTLDVNLNGNVKLRVRTAATGTTFAGCEQTLQYTAEVANKFDERVLYKFINKYSEKSMDVSGGSSSENTPVIQYGYHGGGNQIGYFIPVGNDEYKISLGRSGKVLSPQNLSKDENAPLVQSSYENLDIQKWKLIDLGENEYQIINVETGYALTAQSDRYKITNSKIKHTNNQIWKIEHAQEEAIPNVSFSFDGENAGKIMGSDDSMEYSVDGGKTWKDINKENMTIPDADLFSINAENDIKVKVVGNVGIANIDITEGEKAPKVESDDELNIINGIDSSMEYSIDDGESWKTYSESNQAKFMSDMNVLVRIARSGTRVYGESVEVKFTAGFTTDFVSQTSYKIINKDTKKSFDLAAGSSSEGARIMQYGYAKSSNQQWFIEDLGDGSVKIVSCSSSKVFTPKDKSTAEGAKSSQTTFNDLDIQKWKIVSLGNNEYQIINKETGFAATAPRSNSDIEHYPLTNKDNQTWIIEYTFDIPKVSFSFDGDNAGKLIGTNNTMEYSIDGSTWKGITEDDMVLPESEIAQINAENDIEVRVKGSSESAKINIADGYDAPKVEADDELNIIKGIDSSMEYSIDGGNTWIKYSQSEEMQFIDNMNVLVRTISSGTKLPGKSTELKFTKEEETANVIFSFYGDNAGKLMGSDSSMEYTIDNGLTWKDITENDMLIPEVDLSLITLENGIGIRIKGNSKILKIEIDIEAPKVEADDELNVINGIDESMEYSIDDGETWVKYLKSDDTKFTGDMNVLVRYISNGSIPNEKNAELNFTFNFGVTEEGERTYKIINKETKKSFDVSRGSHDEGRSIIQYRYQESGNQQWIIDDVGDGFVTMAARKILKVFTPVDKSAEEGAKSCQTTFSDLDIQKWKLVSLGNNEYKIINKETGLAATASDDRREIINSKINNEDSQIWIIDFSFDEVVPEAIPTADEENMEKIMDSQEKIEETVSVPAKEVTEENSKDVNIEENEPVKEITEGSLNEDSTDKGEISQEVTKESSNENNISKDEVVKEITEDNILSLE